MMLMALATMLLAWMPDPERASKPAWEFKEAGYLYRAYHAAAYLPDARVTLFFGGFPPDAGQCYLWQGRMGWRTGPHRGAHPRWFHSMTYIDSKRAALVYGGMYGNQVLEDAWMVNQFKWRALGAVLPGPRHSHAAAYDAGRDVLVVFGGSRFDDPLNDTWELDLASWGWSRIEDEDAGPSPRTDACMVYDARRGGIVLFGGWGETGPLGDTWFYNGTWAQLELDGPAPRYAATMVWDSERQVSVLSGGATWNVEQFNDTWVLGASWRELVAPGPLQRSGAAMAYDTRRGVVVLHGGYHTTVGDLPDTWEFNWE
jgi:hypothetical protein